MNDSDDESPNLTKFFLFCFVTITPLFLLGALLIPRLANRVYKIEPAVPEGWHVVGEPSLVKTRLGKYESRIIQHDHVNRVFMHDPAWYTLYLDITNSSKLDVESYHLFPTIIADVGNDSPMWAKIKQVADHSNTTDGLIGYCYSQFEIHIHANPAFADVNGAGWEYKVAKHTESGITVEISH